MERHNCLKPALGKIPLIHEVHGIPYRVVKTVYDALPWLWSKLGLLAGAVVSTFYVKATLTMTEETQILPYPENINMNMIRNSVLWATTNDGARRYKYRNCYLTPTGLHINIDLEAPENQQGMKVIWNIMLANKTWGKKPHCNNFFENAWEYADNRPRVPHDFPCPPHPTDFPYIPLP